MSQADRTEYMQVLSQVNFFMQQHSPRYGFVVTDTEYPIKRLDANGNLLVAQSITWEAAGPGCFSILLSPLSLTMCTSMNHPSKILCLVRDPVSDHLPKTCQWQEISRENCLGRQQALPRHPQRA